MGTIKNLAVAMLIAMVTSVSTAWALDLDEAKSQGLVGETPSGYLKAVATAGSAEVQALVESVNTKRREMYKKIAEKRGAPVESVEKLAAKKAFEKTQPGHYLLAPSGSWYKK